MRFRGPRIVALALLAPAAAAQSAGSELTAQQALDRARTAEAEGDHSTAGDMYLEMVQREPGDLQWVFAASDALVRAKRYDEALETLETAGARFDSISEIPTRRARTHKLHADDLEASGSPPLRVQVELEEAARIAEEVLRDSPWERDARAVLVEALLRLERLEPALTQAAELVRRFPRDAEAHVLLGDIHYRDFLVHQGRLDVEQLDDEGRQTLAEIAQAARSSAIAAYSQATVLAPDAAFPHSQLGRLHAGAGDVEEALAAYQRALTRDPACAVDHGWINAELPAKRRAIFYRVSGEQYAKRDDADVALGAVLDWYHAYARYELEDYESAYELFNAAIEANPIYLNSRSYAMLAAYWNGDHSGAELQAALYAQSSPKHFAETVAKGPDPKQSVSILEFLARRSHDAGRLERCCAISHVLAHVLDTERHWNNYAFLCRETQRFEDSLVGYENALEIAPGSPQLLNDAALILHYHLANEDNLRRAEAYYERAITEATAIVADENATKQAVDAARTAKSNATTNLAKLRAQRK